MVKDLLMVTRMYGWRIRARCRLVLKKWCFCRPIAILNDLPSMHINYFKYHIVFTLHWAHRYTLSSFSTADKWKVSLSISQSLKIQWHYLWDLRGNTETTSTWLHLLDEGIFVNYWFILAYWLFLIVRCSCCWWAMFGHALWWPLVYDGNWSWT